MGLALKHNALRNSIFNYFDNPQMNVDEFASKREHYRKKFVNLSDVEKDIMIKELQKKKVALLDEHGIFGGGAFVNRQHQNINVQLEALGVEE